MTKCANCGTQNNGSAKFCKSCGTALTHANPSPQQPDASQDCPTCAHPAAPGARFCKKCGTALSDRTAPVVKAAASGAELASLPSVEAVRVTARAAPEPDKRIIEPAQSADAGTDIAVEKPADGAPTPAPSVDTAQPSGLVSHAGTKGLPYLKAGIGVIVFAGLLGGGAYWWSGSHKSSDSTPQAMDPSVRQTPAPVPTPPVAPAVAPVSPKPEPAASSRADAPAPPAMPAAATPQVEHLPSAPPAQVPDSARVAKPAQPKRPALTLRPEAPLAARPAPSSGLSEKVSTMLGKGDGYIANQQYDKAVAIGESVLVLDPDNGAAKALIRRAKARQLDALKSGTSLD